MPSKERRTEPFSVRLTPTSKRLLNEVALMYGESPAGLSAQLIEDGLERLLSPEFIKQEFEKREARMLEAIAAIRQKRTEQP